MHVVGVEIGNEVYFEWAGLMMGFQDVGEVSAFIHYWDYINGYEYVLGDSGVDPDDGTYGEDFDLSTVLPSDVLADHDYLGALKSFDGTLKIGIPAENFDPCLTWDTPFIIDDPDEETTLIGGGPEEPCTSCDYPQWNIDLETKFEETIGIGTSTYNKFDAIILHDYYVAGNAHTGCNVNTNWQAAAAEPNFTADAPYSTQWTLPGFDANIGELFEGIAGIPTDPEADATFEDQAGNFKQFIRTRLKNGFNVHSTYLHFDAIDEEQTKEVWFTEYNILNKTKGGTATEDAPFVNMVPNTFAHAVVLENWALWNAKEYFDPDYKPGIFTIATSQAFLGGNAIDMMTASSRNDQVILDLPDPDLTCDANPPYPEDAYYVPRTTYFISSLLNTIPQLDLKYEKTFIGMYINNNNIPPTTFLELDEEGEPINVYVYYTNIKQTTQKYAFDPNTLYTLIDGATSVTLGAATVYCINPAQLYSTSGRNAMFEDDINTGYSCSPGQPVLPHPFEIVNTATSVSGTSCPGGFTPPTGGVCVTVPATSAGYFVIPITPDYRKGIITPPFRLYPNPSDKYFIIQNTIDGNSSDLLQVNIYSSFGTLVQSASVRPGEIVNTEKMPAGVYNVVVIDQSNYSQNIKFTKIH